MSNASTGRLGATEGSHNKIEQYEQREYQAFGRDRRVLSTPGVDKANTPGVDKSKP